MPVAGRDLGDRFLNGVFLQRPQVYTVEPAVGREVHSAVRYSKRFHIGENGRGVDDGAVGLCTVLGQHQVGDGEQDGVGPVRRGTVDISVFRVVEREPSNI